MDILGIGPLELIAILIVALMVFGPDRLPTIGAKLGRAMRDMRRATRAISEEINNTRSAVEGSAREVAEPLQDVTDAAKAISTAASAIQNPRDAIRDSVLRELNALRSDASAQAAPTATDGEQAAAASDEAERRIAPPELPSPLVEAGQEPAEPAPGVDALPPVEPEGGAGIVAPAESSPDPDPSAHDGSPRAPEA